MFYCDENEKLNKKIKQSNLGSLNPFNNLTLIGLFLSNFEIIA